MPPRAAHTEGVDSLRLKDDAQRSQVARQQPQLSHLVRASPEPREGGQARDPIDGGACRGSLRPGVSAPGPGYLGRPGAARVSLRLLGASAAPGQNLLLLREYPARWQNKKNPRRKTPTIGLSVSHPKGLHICLSPGVELVGCLACDGILTNNRGLRGEISATSPLFQNPPSVAGGLTHLPAHQGFA